MESREVKLPSGAVLKVQAAPFAEAEALFEAMLEEGKALKISGDSEIDYNFLKDAFCAGFSSKKIKAALWNCMKRALYNDKKISPDTFESVEARGDYLTVCFEVAVENVSPFTKSLYAQLSNITGVIQNLHA